MSKFGEGFTSKVMSLSPLDLVLKILSQYKVALSNESSLVQLKSGVGGFTAPHRSDAAVSEFIEM